jgi:hypothetical protein
VIAAGHFDALFINEQGELTEGARSNLFVEKNGVLLTPPCERRPAQRRLRRRLLRKARRRKPASARRPSPRRGDLCRQRPARPGARPAGGSRLAQKRQQ